MSKAITIANPELERYINSVSRVKGDSFEAVVEKLLTKAMKDNQYRSNRNAQKWQETKAMKERLEELEKRVLQIGRVDDDDESLVSLDEEGINQ